MQEGSFQEHGGSITAAEFDRLAFLMRSSAESCSHSMEGSPMDTSPTPFSGDNHSMGYCNAQNKECPALLQKQVDYVDKAVDTPTSLPALRCH